MQKFLSRGFLSILLGEKTQGRRIYVARFITGNHPAGRPSVNYCLTPRFAHLLKNGNKQLANQHREDRHDGFVLVAQSRNS